ncbi:site-specific integrase [Bradyrhizobium diazoefficiens]|nr:site-specific integrase [Bradyrhizobium diazoefficiens]UCF53530.1 MAG: site-specific integrase [Bradyrhizobium sp.]MBR0968513.1 site-specific integrase [Bradyrhizobium diazoefficiens]MBR0981837.1 site-specific integrase [Bradyrhizobium diazoefficiens]MBR1011288.1 site-specific integrase [Bradyrhizobium diazoefficiens]MBR1015755.1 site-specific integrase [Bradyrhizobium diazoefficiens]
MAEHHELMGGKLHVYKRENSRHWQCSTYLAGKNRRISTKEESLSHAKEIAEDWYLELRGKSRAGQLTSGPTFKKAADQFLQEYETITNGERSETWVAAYGLMLRVHILPFFGKLALTEITAGKLQEYRVHRRQTAMERIGRPPSRSSMHHEMVAIRQVLKTALRHNWLQFLPDMTQPYKTSGKISHRAWFSPEEYKKLYTATRRRADKPLHNRGRWKWECEQLHDYVLFMANTGLRPDEASRLQFRDVAIVKDRETKETILEIEVRGKRGVGFCKSTSSAVEPFRRLQARLRDDGKRDPAIESGQPPGRSKERPSQKPKGDSPQASLVPPKGGEPQASVALSKEKPKAALSKPRPTDLVFPNRPRELLNSILDETELKRDRDGKPRTAYSLRHTYICFRLMEGADIYQIAKNCRTSVEMIEKFYAAHIKTTLDAAAINVRKGVIARERKTRESLAE